ncbi:MAG: hypothetical protein ACLTMR_00100 [Faecalibacillus sp.]
MKVNTENEEFAAKGFINATDCADYLVKHGKVSEMLINNGRIGSLLYRS